MQPAEKAFALLHGLLYERSIHRNIDAMVSQNQAALMKARRVWASRATPGALLAHGYVRCGGKNYHR
jgi:hypothetical protein